MARTTGMFYLGLAISGLLGFLVVRTQLFVPGDAQGTLANLTGNDALVRAGIALELLVVLTQTLVAVWFYRLFRATDRLAAAGIAAFGLVNAVIILISAGLLGTAAEIARDPIGDPATGVQLMYAFSGHLWIVAGVFFGLWLVPMGWCVLRTGRMPRALGWLLIAGGAGYVISTFVAYVVPDPGPAGLLLTMPATAGEFWMLGYLIIRGDRAVAAIR